MASEFIKVFEINMGLKTLVNGGVDNHSLLILSARATAVEKATEVLPTPPFPV